MFSKDRWKDAQSEVSTEQLANRSALDIVANLKDTLSQFDTSSDTDVSLSGTSKESVIKEAHAEVTYTEALGSVVGIDPGTNESITTFVSSTDQDKIDNPYLQNVASSATEIHYSSKDMLKVSQLTGQDISDPKVADRELKSWYSEKLKVLAANTSALQEYLSDVPLSSYVEHETQVLKDITDPSDVKEFVDTRMDVLPPNLKNALNTTADNTLGSMSNRIGAIGNGVTSLTNFGEDAWDVLQNGNYPAIADEFGNPIEGMGGLRVGFNKIQDLYKDANSLCDEIVNAFKEFSGAKDIFDMLLNEAINSGLGNLIAALLNCGQDTSRTRYHDSRTSYLAYLGLEKSSYNGDPYSFKQLQDFLGDSAIYDVKDSMFKLGSNTKFTEADKVTYTELLNMNSITANELFEDTDDFGITAIDTDKLTVATKNSDYLPNQAYDEDTQLLALNLSSQYFK
jgi:hypothetical protein